MQTFNQSLADLYFRGLITYETAMTVTSFPEELTDIIQRREGTRGRTSSMPSGNPRK